MGITFYLTPSFDMGTCKNCLEKMSVPTSIASIHSHQVQEIAYSYAQYTSLSEADCCSHEVRNTNPAFWWPSDFSGHSFFSQYHSFYLKFSARDRCNDVCVASTCISLCIGVIRLKNSS